MFAKLVCYKDTHFHSFCSITSVFAHLHRVFGLLGKVFIVSLLCCLMQILLGFATRDASVLLLTGRLKSKNKTVFRFCAPMMK